MRSDGMECETACDTQSDDTETGVRPVEVHVSNTASGTISEFSIGVDGSLFNGVHSGHDARWSVGHGAYFRWAAPECPDRLGDIEVFRIDATNGGLTRVQVVTGLPAGSNGLASF
jgi:hypothetical protein